MSSRRNQEREMRLQPKMVNEATVKLKALGLTVLEVTDTCVTFEFEKSRVQYFPYSGWHSGKTITDGRGWKNLEKQLKSI